MSAPPPAVFPRFLVGCLILLLSAGAARADNKETPNPADKVIHDYLAAKTARISGRFLDGATTQAEWDKRRPRLYREYLEMLGLWPLPKKTPLKATVTGTREHEGVVIEKLHFQSRPGLYVTGNLYRRKRLPKSSRLRKSDRLPAVLYVCGHSGKGRDGNKTAFQDHGLWFATNGYICLVIDTLQLGEIPGIHHGTYSHGRWWWQAAGYTPAGVECWNGIRAIDYLVSRPDVDPRKIAVTGISGGGATTVWIAAADERVKCAVPVSGMSDLESYVANKVINGHCDCMFLVNTYAWEWTTIAALIAPRPLLFCNSDRDPIFPMDGNRRIIARLRKLYKLYGKPELVNAHVSKGGHDYRPDLRLAIFKWINKFIKNDTGSVKDAAFKLLPGKELRVFPTNRDIPKDAINGKIDETFVPRTQVKLPKAEEFDFWKKGLLKQLRGKSFPRFPERIPVPEGGRNKKDELPNKNKDLLWWDLIIAEPPLRVLIVSVNGRKDDRQTGTLVVFDANEKGTETPKWARSLTRDQSIHLVKPRGGWTQKSPPNYVERAHALLGRTVDEGRVWDIAATVRWMVEREKHPRKWKVIGRGQAGILAAYAALFEPSISEVVIVDPPASHRAGPIFLNVLRVLDVPDALGLLAPRPLTLLNARDKAFDRTAAIYKAAGAKDKFRRSNTR